MINNTTDQRSLDWYRQRLGCVTGSKVSVLMSKGRKKEDLFSVTAKSYLYELVAERMFSPDFLNDDDVFNDYVQQVNVTTKAMQWGIDNEDSARRLYEKITGHEVILVSSCAHDTIPHFAASPDGMVRNVDGEGNMGVLEIKCPSLGTFAQYKAEIKGAEGLKAVKPEYYWQMMAEMACTDAVCGDFVAYCPWLTDPILIAHIARNDDDIKLMEQRVIEANKFIDDIIQVA